MQSTQFIHIHKSHFLLHDLSYGRNKSYLEVKLENMPYHTRAFILNGLDFSINMYESSVLGFCWGYFGITLFYALRCLMKFLFFVPGFCWGILGFCCSMLVGCLMKSLVLFRVYTYFCLNKMRFACN